jgi:anti-sigma regulatory factor (Ser/Thr protein kinase)
VEGHDDDIDAGIARLGRGLVPAGDPNVVCDTALRVMGRQDAADDIAMLVVSPRETDQQVASLTIPPDPGTVSAVRARTAELIEGWTTPERMDRASLLVSELVTNAIRHAGGQVRVRMRRGSRTISVEVADNDTRVPRPRRAAGTDEGGRGLQLVDALADRWGVRPTGEGKVVWFELRRDAGEPTGRGSSR